MADEKPEAEEQEAAPEPHPLTVTVTTQFPAVENEGLDEGGNPIVRVAKENLLEVMIWLRDNEATAFDYLADQTVTDWTERTPRIIWMSGPARDLL